MATIRKRTGKKGTTYQVQIRIKGGGIETATFPNSTKAKLWAQSVEASIRDGRYFTGSAAKKHTLSDLVERFLEHPSLKLKTSSVYQPQLKWWLSHIGDSVLAEITPGKIAGIRDKLIQNRIKPSSANRYVSALSSAFTMAVREFGWAESNPCSKVRKLPESRGRIRFLTEDERAALLDACEKSRARELHIMVVLALSTGARKNELRWLRWSDVDLHQGTLLFRETKNGSIRSVPIQSLAFDLLKEWGKVRLLDTDLVFPGRNPKHPVLFEKSWRKVLVTAGIKDFRFHDLRHSAASYFVMNGVNLRAVSEILGHKTLNMVQRYSHLSPEHLRSEMARTMEAVNL